MSAASWSATAIAALAILPAGASAQDANQKIDALEKRIAELEAKLPKDAGSSGDTMKWNDFSALGSRFQLYGFLRLDAYYDDSRPNNIQLPAYIRSEDPNAPAGFRAPLNEDDFTMSAKLTRLGLNFTGPTIGGLGDAQVLGKLETDFYNTSTTDSREALRIRVAYLQLKWNEFSLYAGQMWDVIAPLYPIVNPDNVMWNAGNLGDRRPQLRGDYTIGDTTKFDFQGMIGETGAIDGQDLDPAGTTGNGYLDGSQSGIPTLQARAAVNTPISDWKQHLEFGLWAHRAKEETDVPVGTATHFDSSAYGVDLQSPIYEDKLWLKGELWVGRNLGDVRGGILQDINATGKPIRSQGGWTEIGWQLPGESFKPVKVYAGYAWDNPENGDLSPNSAANAARTRNTTWYGAIRFDFKPVTFGLDYLHWVTSYQQFHNGTDNRLQAYISYAF
jgi:hypothetical protein